MAENGLSPSAKELVGRKVIDESRQKWKVGEPLGDGSFGLVFEDNALTNPVVDTLHKKAEPIPAKVPPGSKYVIKMEMRGNVTAKDETKFYKKCAGAEMIKEWKKARQLRSLGIPHYVASGRHVCHGKKMRFIIIPRYDGDLANHIKEKGIKGTPPNGNRLGQNTVVQIALMILNALEFVHKKGYIHADVKPENIMVELRGDGTGKMDAFLCDFGLVQKWSNVGNILVCGTTQYMIRDAHDGKHGRCGDLESLAFNMYSWLYGTLPWSNTPINSIKSKKQNFMNNINRNKILNSTPGGDVVKKLLLYVQTLGITEEPDYSKVRDILKGIDVDIQPLRRYPIRTRTAVKANDRPPRHGRSPR